MPLDVEGVVIIPKEHCKPSRLRAAKTIMLVSMINRSWEQAG